MSNAIIQRVLHRLVNEIGPRPPASPANHAAEDFLAAEFARLGYTVERQEYAATAWEHRSTRLKLGGAILEVAANPYSPPCKVETELVVLRSLPELESAELRGCIAVLCGDLLVQPLSAKSWFLKSETDERTIQALEKGRPAAILCVQRGLTGPLGLIEDWEFSIPSATVTPQAGLKLVQNPGAWARLVIEAEKQPGTAANIVARKPGFARSPGTRPERLVFMAHFDTKFGTPGAMDNASGVASLLAIAGSLAQQETGLSLEFIAFNNEEYLPIGDDEYFRRLGENPAADILAALNLDLVGQQIATDTWCTLGSSPAFHAHLGELAKDVPHLIETEPWYESNHSSFLMRGCPVVALGGKGYVPLHHSAQDTLEWVDPGRVARLAEFCVAWARSLEGKDRAWSRPNEATEDGKYLFEALEK
jgi:aminopeptidase YwaD